MLSYRHAFHAGNSTDALKHTILTFCLDYLGQKEKPYLCIDTHAGSGVYSLNSIYANQNREWENGIGVLRKTNKSKLPAILLRYLEVADGENYCGSSGIMKKLIRNQDRLCSFELHPADFMELENLFKETPNAKAFNTDGFQGLLSLLPPISRRACIFIDPSYEINSDYDLLPDVLTKSLKIFPQGLYIIWHPILYHKKITFSFQEKIMNLYDGNRFSITLFNDSNKNMYASGLVIYNPPWTLKKAVEEISQILPEVFKLTLSF